MVNIYTHNIKFTMVTILSVQALSIFTLLCNHYHHPFPELSSSSQTKTLYPLNSSSIFLPSTSPWQPLYYFLFLLIFLWQLPLRSRIIQYFSFHAWLISLSMGSLRFIHIISCVRISFVLKTESHCMYIPHFFIHSLMDGQFMRSVQRVPSHVIWKIETFIEEDTRHIALRTVTPQSPSK